MDAVYNAAVTIKRFKMFPLFEVAHYMLTCMSVSDYTLSIQKSSYRNGGFIGNFLLGEPLITPLQKNNNILIVTLIWYLTNYSPFDLYRKFLKLSVVKFLLNILKEIRRASNIDQGIIFALKVIPNSLVIPLAFGALKGTATSHMKVIHRLVCGVWQPSAIELLNPSIITKSSIVASSLFLLHRLVHFPISLPTLHLIILIFFFITRIVDFFQVDPYKPLENLIGCLMTGGIGDSLNRALRCTTKYFNLSLSLSDEAEAEGGKGKKDE